MSCSPVGRRLVGGGGYTPKSIQSSVSELSVWARLNGQPKFRASGLTCCFNGVAFSADGAMMAAGCDDRTVRIWDVIDWRPRQVFKGHADRVLSVAFSHDGRFVASGSDDHTVRLWNINGGQEVLILKGHAAPNQEPTI